MIKELILSLILSAASSLPFLDSPKRVVDWSEFDTFSGTISYDGFGGANEFSGEYYIGNSQGSFTFDQYGSFDGDWVTIGQYEDRDIAKLNGSWSISGGTYTFYIVVSFYLETLAYEDDIEIIENFQNSATAENSNYPISNFTYGNCYVDDGPYEEDDMIYIAMVFVVTFSSSGLEQGASFDFSYRKAQPQTPYTITTTLNNCVILSVPTLPQTFTASEVGNQYVIQAAANSGGYGFTSSSLSVTGAQVSNITYSQEQGNTGYYNGLNFTLTLQAANCTISITAYLPTYTLTSELNNCSVSPSLPSTINYGLVQTYTFTANSGYAFNNVVTQWEITGANIGEITYSSLLYGNLYSQVSIELGFIGGNASVKVTAAQYDINSYQEGYDNGYTNGDTAGYNRGYSQGLTAGNSYGVWNWLKQAALTTGEFLSVPLLPGFSIGALLTAIAGLVIIWLFIKGFLFKS